MQNVIPRLDETPGQHPQRRAPLGAHNLRCFSGELGYTDEQIEELRRSGVIVAEDQTTA